MTVGTLISRVKRTFPNEDAAVLLEDVQEIHDELCRLFPLIRSTQVITTLAVGDRDYALTALTQRVRQVRYYTSANVFTKLKATTRDRLDLGDGSWRTDPNGPPEEFFAEAGVLYLVPAPNLASSGSPAYPRIEADLQLTETLADATVLPTGVNSYKAWEEGVKMIICDRNEDSRYSVYERNFNKQKGILHAQVFLTAQDVNQRIDTRPPTNRSVI